MRNPLVSRKQHDAACRDLVVQRGMLAGALLRLVEHPTRSAAWEAYRVLHNLDYDPGSYDQFKVASERLPIY